ncbi:DUF1127 domain-containing protein [Algihabitans albus]|uniref:DUF1127 domain-containing protein n=1 Tax=Algihabitans albus TaxID=2164067 RepID=UPI001ABC27E7|nr:DUF1127 domain-containing protein [Algihabitans albus]
MTYMSSIDQPQRISGTVPLLRAPLRRPRRNPFMHLLHALMALQRHAEERERILELDDRMLRDIGVSRSELLRSLYRGYED